MSLYHSTNWLLDLAMLVLPCVLASPVVATSVNGVYCTSYTALVLRGEVSSTYKYQ